MKELQSKKLNDAIKLNILKTRRAYEELMKYISSRKPSPESI